jgi:hypothetical protein
VPPQYDANLVPSMARSTEVAPIAVHASWIMVGPLQTGVAGLTVYPVIRTLDCVVVGDVVPPPGEMGPSDVDEVVVAAAVVEVSGAEDEVVVDDDVVVAVLDLALLLQPATTTRATPAASIGVRNAPRVRIKGG